VAGDSISVIARWFRISILLISFVSLMIFSLRMLQPELHIGSKRRIYWILGLAGYTLLIFLFIVFTWSSHNDLMTHVDAGVRYFLAVPAAALAGVAMLRRASQAQREGNQNWAKLYRCSGGIPGVCCHPRWSYHRWTFFRVMLSIQLLLSALPGSLSRLFGLQWRF
jgi:hypothetical protein